VKSMRVQTRCVQGSAYTPIVMSQLQHRAVMRVQPLAGDRTGETK
jgi:hypothetical protein